MKAIILAAGLGTRMQATFPFIPKSMLTIGGKPLIQDQIEYLKIFGISDFYINLHFLPKKIKGYLGDGTKMGVNIVYSFEKELLGTSGALDNFKKKLNQSFIVLYGDIFTRLNFKQLLKFHKSKRSKATILIHKTNHPQDSDLIEINKENQINHIYVSPHQTKLPQTLYSNAGIYILEPTVLQFLPKGNSDFMEDFFPLLLQNGLKIYGYFSNDYSKDIGTPKRYKEVQDHFLNEKKQV